MACLEGLHVPCWLPNPHRAVYSAPHDFIWLLDKLNANDMHFYDCSVPIVCLLARSIIHPLRCSGFPKFYGGHQSCCTTALHSSTSKWWLTTLSGLWVKGQVFSHMTVLKIHLTHQPLKIRPVSLHHTHTHKQQCQRKPPRHYYHSYVGHQSFQHSLNWSQHYQHGLRWDFLHEVTDH